MSSDGVPENFHSLHEQEELLRSKALELIAANGDLALHLAIVESAMDLADLLRQVPTEGKDFKVLQILSIRTFNAFGASIKLALSGYSQNSALVMRDILETVFLTGMFSKDRSAIKLWREPSLHAPLGHEPLSPMRMRENPTAKSLSGWRRSA